jgi:hypothetical protein
LQHQPPGLQRNRFIGNLERALDILLHHQHGRALVGQLAQELEDVLHHDGRQADGGLVNQQHLGPQQQRAANLKLLLLPAREGRCLGIHALFHAREKFQHLRNPLMRGLHANRDAAQLQVLEDRELSKQVAPLRHKGNALGQQRFLRGTAHVHPVQQHLALARLEQAKQGLEHGRFARAIGPQQQRDGAALGLE